MKSIVTIALVSLPALGHAQTPANRADAAITPAAGTFFAVSVANLDATERWYAEKLGLTRVMRGERMGRLAGYAVLEGNGWTVELIRHDDSARPTAKPLELTQGFMKAGARVANLDAAVAFLRARGVEIVMGPYPARETVRANLVFKDNEGNLIQLFGDYLRK